MSVLANHSPLLDDAAFAHDRPGFDDKVGVEGTAVADGSGVNGVGGVDYCEVADGGSGLNDGGRDSGAEGGVIHVHEGGGGYLGSGVEGGMVLWYIDCEGGEGG